MIPSIEQAEQELKIAEQLNPTPWVQHSVNVGIAAREIAKRCPGLDEKKAYVFGILHDIGRRAGILTIPEHVYEGYLYCKEKGWNEVAKICMSHSYPMKEKEISEDAVDEEAAIKEYIANCEYDDYDRLIIMCDSLAFPHGFGLLEQRFVDSTRRYGIWEHTVERWNKIFEFKKQFEARMGCSIYDVLPNIKETIFMESPSWTPPTKGTKELK